MSKSNDEIYDAVMQVNVKIENHMAAQCVKNKIGAFALTSVFSGMIAILVKVFSAKV